jgi:hypothetical protein
LQRFVLIGNVVYWQIHIGLGVRNKENPNPDKKIIPTKSS